MGKVYIFDHPLIQHKLSIMRNKETNTKEFRELLSEIAMLMTYEITRDLPVEQVEVETPIGPATVPMLKKQPICLVPILRAGLGMVDAILRLLPNAKVGHIGMYRDEKTFKPVPYYCKLPTEAPNSPGVLSMSTICTRMWISTSPLWTKASTSTPTSCPVCAMPVTGSSAQNKLRSPLPCLTGHGRCL